MWKFAPILKTTIWGGNNIIPLKHMEAAISEVGESWEISSVPGSVSVVESGPDEGLTLNELIDRYGSDLMGERNYKKFDNSFPLLVKIIDAADNLSVQVHPDDSTAAGLGYPNGKTEMWYVLNAGKDARIANGFTRPVDPEEYESLVESGRIEEILKYINIKAGEVYYIPAGRVHAICKNCTMVEVQQTSDATFRIYDYHRKDKDGNERELHTALARQAINFADIEGESVDYTLRPNFPVNVIRSPFFSINILEADTGLMRDYSESDTFVVITALDGETEIICGGKTETLTAGLSVLIPASATGIAIEPHKRVRLLEAYIK
ncbi:MAG: class I mannose-6-phosphate isomerase [Muribaculaceae bacterium]|nr:class I mannose-6-phosphate isomerase [Muribaculaceae bacterium]